MIVELLYAWENTFLGRFSLRKVVEAAKKERFTREVMEEFGSTDPVEMARSLRKRMYDTWNEKRNR